MPRKVFVAGEILTAADVNTNLMDQSVMVFDDSAARGSAIPSPSEGMVTYLKDTDAVTVFDGSAYKPVGGILQVVSTAETGTFTASVAAGASSADVMTVTITPSSTSSKILVLAQINIASFAGGATYGYLLRDGSASDYRGAAAGSRVRVATVDDAGSGRLGAASIMFLDSPNTTSATTYSIQLGHNQGSSANVYLNRAHTDTDVNTIARGASSITVMEVAG